MRSTAFWALLASALPALAEAQDSTPPSAPPAGVQAQGNASAQGSATVQRSGPAAAQSDSSASGAASGSVSKGDRKASADTGTATNAVLSGSLNAKKAKPGDPVAAKTTEPSSTSDHTALPKGTRLLGRITEVRAAGSGEGQSTLTFVFDRAVLRDGREMPISATVRALAAAEGAVDASSTDMAGSTSGTGRSMSSGAGAAGGVVGGAGASATGALGGALGGAGHVAGGATGTLSTAGGASGHALTRSAGALGGLNAQGMLTHESQGVFGLNGVSLVQSTTGASSVVASGSKNLRLESGTRMLLSLERQSPNAAPASSAQPAQ